MSDTITMAGSEHEIPGELRNDLTRAAATAAAYEVTVRPASYGVFKDRVNAARAAIRRLERELAALPESPEENDPRIGLFDLRSSPRVLRTAVTSIEPLPRKGQELPLVALPQHREEPRVATLAAVYLRSVKGRACASSLVVFLTAFQAHEALTLREIWDFPSYLRFILLEAIVEEAESALRGNVSSLSHVRILFAGMRTIVDIDWTTILEPQIAFDATLRQDPTETYARMDFDSRELYRKRVALIARHSDLTELQVAEHALDLAREGQQQPHSDPRIHQRLSHVGYYLVSKGFGKLAERVNYHPPLPHRLRAAIRANADDFYITGIELITILVIAAVLFPLLPNYSVSGKLVVTLLLMIMPAMQCAVELMNNSVTAIFDPEALPKMDFSARIPQDCATLVAVPTLLLNEKQVRELVDELEVRFLANRDPNLHFVLLTDLPDSTAKPNRNDANPLVSLAMQLIDGLNARYSSDGSGGFLFLHRLRIFNVRQGVWMGWERKRGKLLDLNKLLVGEYDAFPIKAGRLEVLRSIRYILTLDSDTQLPRGSAASMVGTMAHPLNQAIVDPKLHIVVDGYGILQPRVGVSVSSASRSRLASLYSGQSGVDIYTRAISDPYQDLYGEGIFTGKGLYEVAVLHAVLNRRFPRNSLLSHDLIEGAYARAGLVTDLEVIDDYPSHYSAYTRRKHRWVRGDWQITQWIFSRVPDESNRMVPNPISTINRWKIFDNLRRSLVEPFTFILFVAGWLWLPGGPLYWTIVPLILFLFPTVLQLAFGLGRALVSERKGTVAQSLEGTGQALLLSLLNLSFLPHQAMLVLDAIFRSLIRRFITGERLLEWETAAEAESQNRKITPVDRYLALMPFVACGIALVVFLSHHQRTSFLVASPVLLLWCMATALTAWLNRPPRELRQLSSTDRGLLMCHALRTWRYFSEFGAERHNYLVPDNVEENGLREAPRVSPTNIGLLLNARQAAVEFGFLTAPEFAHLTCMSLVTIERLEKLRGHLYNWYDTQSCRPLETNPFVSTVDSGNFVASLYTLHAGAREMLRKPLFSRALVAGLRPHWELMQEQKKLPSPLAKLTLPSPVARTGEWITWLRSAAREFKALPTSGGPENWWRVKTEQRIHSILALVHDYVPWLDPEFAALRQVPEFALDASADTRDIEHAVIFAQDLERKLSHAATVSGTRQSLASQLHAQLGPAIRNLRTLADALRTIAEDAERLADATEFGFLVDPVRRILSIGYDVNQQKSHSSCYDMLASEARIATYLAVARGELPQQSWFKLSREFTQAFGVHVLMSWTGTMFEYLMPALWMRSHPNTLISGTLAGCVRVQQALARSLGIPWGISESGAARRDESGNYRYFAWGVPQLALFWDATAGPVVSPYSTFLALGIDAAESVRNLRRMAAAGWVGEYGFYESVDYTTGVHNGDIVREWMAHHEGMSLLAILNCLCDDVVQHWFHSNAIVQSAELLLHEVPRSKAALRAMMKDFAFVPPRAEAA